MKKQIQISIGRQWRFLALLVFLCLCSAAGYAQNNVKVTGRVVDNKGEPLLGVNVVVKGNTSLGTITDIDGKYNIAVPSTNSVLQFSYIGYLGQEIPVDSKPEINVIMHEDTKSLDEVIVVGYGTMRKKDLTGSVVRVNLDAIQESPNVNLLSSMQGTTAGLNVGAITKAGEEPEISIRGRNSLSGTQSPLIVLDGMIYRGKLIDLNPNDIVSVDVLKDASAAAIYGSQASNGVLLITSKSGKTMKKATVDYSFTYTLQSIANKDMLPEDAAGYLRKVSDRYLGESRIGQDMLTLNPNFDPLSKCFPGVAEGQAKGIDNNFWDLLTNKHPYIQAHSLSVSGRNESTSYFLSFGYTQQENVVINDNYKRYNFRINLDTKITDWLKVGVQSFLTLGNQSGVSPSISDIITMPPQIQYKTNDGDLILQPYRGGYNIFWNNLQDDLNERLNLMGNFYADIDIPFIKGLNYRLNVSQNLIQNKRYNFDSLGDNLQGQGYKQNNSEYQYMIDNILSYRRTFGLHAISGTFVYGIEKRQYENTTATASNFSNKTLGYDRLQVGDAARNSISTAAWQEASLYQMLRGGYIYDERYIFNATVRRDGFSGFGKNNKTGIFPSAAAAWRISSENFMKNVHLVDDLKLRVSYGLNGNRTVNRYQTLAQVGTDGTAARGYFYGQAGTAQLGQLITSMPNSNLKWETTKSLNLAVDFDILNHRLFGTVETYVANTFNLLYNINIPLMNGFGSIATNIGKLNNKGVELTLTGVPVRTKDFSWDITFNFSLNRNKVVSILGPDANGIEQDIASSKIFIGQPYGVAYDYKIIGMWQVDDSNAGRIPSGFTYGSYKLESSKADGSITAADDRHILGYYDPSYRFSFLNSFKYKDLELKFFINSIQGGNNYYLGQPGRTLPNPDNTQGSNSFKFDYWTPENPNARYRQIGQYATVTGFEFSPYVSRSFIRLQDVTLAYDFSKKLLDKLKINRVKVFLNAKNLLTITDWDGWDPEPNGDATLPTPPGIGLDTNAYPLLKSYSFGLNFTF
jgi:TonB-linked SusC/RagA family outer membrane protein